MGQREVWVGQAGGSPAGESDSYDEAMQAFGLEILWVCIILILERLGDAVVYRYMRKVSLEESDNG